MNLPRFIFRHAVGIACEMLTINDPYDHYEAPRLISETKDCHGNTVQQTIYAQNHADATSHLNGVTIQGDRSIVATKIAPNTWDVHIENWDKEEVGQGMTRSADFDVNAWSSVYADWLARHNGS